MKYLGVDYGEAKVGLAIGDDETGLALPIKILKNSGRDQLISDLLSEAKAEDVEQIVVGLPINTRAESSAQTENVRGFVLALAQKTPIAVVSHDERFSSQEAQKLRPGKRDDDIAAMVMLQSYLDTKKMMA